MLEQGFLKSHFVGRDGFIWWIGQVAPEETWKNNFGEGKKVGDNAEIKGFGERYRVRIMGYHTADKDALPDNELPFATVMYPVTAGGGTGGASTNSKIVGGNFVFGFFLDGEDAQQPCIMGVIGYNEVQQVMKDVPSIAFKPFFGTERLPLGGEVVGGNTESLKQETTTGATGNTSTVAGGQNVQQKNVVGVTGYKFRQTNQGRQQAVKPENRIPKSIASGDPNILPIKGIQKSLQISIQTIENLKTSVRKLSSEQIDRIESIQEQINNEIGKAASAVASGIKWIYEMIEEHIFKKINKTFEKVYFMAAPNERENIEGVNKDVTDTIACVFRKLFGQLLGMIKGFIKEAVDKVINVPICFVEKFVGNTLGMVSGILNGTMDAIKGAISGITDLASEGLDLAGDVIDMVSNILSFLKCDDNMNNSPINEWSHVYGTNETFGQGNIANIISKARAYGDKVKNTKFEDIADFDFAQEIDFSETLDPKKIIDGCVTDEFPCGPPKINVFGSAKGSGAVGNAIINKAGEVIGVDMKSFGVGYDGNARITLIDDCGKGKGAVLRPVFGDVNVQHRKPKKNKGKNKGTPASAPNPLGFGNFESFEYPFDEGADDSIRREPFSPDGQAYGTPAFGLGPSFSKLGKRAPKQQLKIRKGDENLGIVTFTVDTFTIPVAETPEKPTVKFVLSDKTGIADSVDTDFDFTPDDQAGRGRLEDGKIVIGKGDDEFELGSKDEIGGQKFRESFKGGQKIRVVKNRKYLVRGFQFNGEPLNNRLKISNNGKCVLVDDVYGRETSIVERKVKVVGDASREVTFDFFHGDATRPNKIFIDELDVFAKKSTGGGKKYKPESITVNVETGKDYEVRFQAGIDSGRAILQLKENGRAVWGNDNPDDDFKDMCIRASDGKFSNLTNGGEKGNPVNTGSATFRIERDVRFETVFEEKLSKSRSDKDYDDLVICTKRGRFSLPKNQKLLNAGAVIYDLTDDKPSGSGDDDRPPIDVSVPISPVLPIPSPITMPIGGGDGAGGIPGILTPGPGNNSTFHPFPGTTTLGPGTWVPGPVPPGGGGPHVGPAVFVHDGQLFGEIIAKKGTPLAFVTKPGSFGAGTGGGGGPNFGTIPQLDPFDPGSFDPGGFQPGTGGSGGGQTPNGIPFGGIPPGPGGLPGGGDGTPPIGGIPRGPSGLPRGAGGSGGLPSGAGGIGELPSGAGGGTPPTGRVPRGGGAGDGTLPGGITPRGGGAGGGTPPTGRVPRGGAGGGTPPTGRIPRGGGDPSNSGIPFEGTGDPGGLGGGGGSPGGIPNVPGGRGGGGGLPPNDGNLPPKDNPPLGPVTILPPGPGIYYPDVVSVGPFTNTPNVPGTMVPPGLSGFDGPGIGIVDVIVEDPGSGYLPTPDGSTGGDGREYSTPFDTRITYEDGTKELPAQPDTRICVNEGDTVILPPGTQVITTPFDGEGGGELIIGGSPHVMKRPGCFTAPTGGQPPESQNTYPVLMYLCDVIIKKPGFGYKSDDRVIIDPDNGAAAELVVDKFGRITDVVVTKSGEGFQVIPKITVDSATGQNASLLAKLCIDRVTDEVEDPEKVIQVIDCVGKF